MSLIQSFQAYRPKAELAARVASVPYDVVNTAEARRLADGNPYSFLHSSGRKLICLRGLIERGDRV